MRDIKRLHLDVYRFADWLGYAFVIGIILFAIVASYAVCKSRHEDAIKYGKELQHHFDNSDVVTIIKAGYLGDSLRICVIEFSDGFRMEYARDHASIAAVGDKWRAILEPPDRVILTTRVTE